MKIKAIIVSLFTLVAVGFASSNANAQEVFSKGTQTGSILVGIPPQFNTYTVPPILLSYEYCVADNLIDGSNGSIGVGATGGYYATGTKNDYVKTFVHSGIIGGRASFHYQFAPKFDTYAGIFLGASIVGGTTTVQTNKNSVVGDHKTDIETASHATAAFGWGAHLGARYYITPQFAINGELGYGYSILNLGVTFRF